MLLKTHLLFGFFLGLLVMPYINPGNQILFILLVLLGSSLPDVDHAKSFWGRKIKVIAWFFKHRGFFHSLFILPVIAWGLWYFFDSTRFTIPLLIGYVTHLMGDMITMEGIMPFTPFSKWTWRGGLFKVGSSVEYIIFGALIIGSGWILIF